MRWLLSTLIGGSMVLHVSAQFQMFEQLFNQGGHHQQQHQQRQQNVASDSEWYQKTYDGGMSAVSFWNLSFVDSCSQCLLNLLRNED